MAAGLYALFILWGNRLPVPSTVDELQPSARSVVLDRHGETIGEYYVEDQDSRPPLGESRNT